MNITRDKKKSVVQAQWPSPAVVTWWVMEKDSLEMKMTTRWKENQFAKDYQSHAWMLNEIKRLSVVCCVSSFLHECQVVVCVASLLMWNDDCRINNYNVRKQALISMKISRKGERIKTNSSN